MTHQWPSTCEAVGLGNCSCHRIFGSIALGINNLFGAQNRLSSLSKDPSKCLSTCKTCLRMEGCRFYALACPVKQQTCNGWFPSTKTLLTSELTSNTRPAFNSSCITKVIHHNNTKTSCNSYPKRHLRTLSAPFISTDGVSPCSIYFFFISIDLQLIPMQ